METKLPKQHFDETYGFKPPENYERFFVPAIGRPVANDLMRMAAIQPGERVLDVACGTGIVARLASEKVAKKGRVAGLDINPGMLAVARTITPPDLPIEWYEASAEAIPLADKTFDVVLCQLGLQFMEDKQAALKEMLRVLVPGGRIFANMPGPAGPVFTVLTKAMEHHISVEAAGFVKQIFSLHDTTELQNLVGSAGFSKIFTHEEFKSFHLPDPGVFLWQYVNSTPLAGIVSEYNEKVRNALEHEVVEKWQDFMKDGTFIYEQRLVTVRATR